jgi:hypothetical protein
VYLDLIIIVFVLLIVYRFDGKVFPYPLPLLIVAYVFYIYAGTIMMFYDEHIVKDQAYDKMVGLVRLGFLALFFAFVVSQSTIKRMNLSNKFIDSFNTIQDSASSIFFVFVVLVSVSYIFAIPGSPLLTSINDPSSLGLVREQATTTFKYFSFYNNFLSFFLPFVWLVYLFKGNRIYLLVLLLNLFLLLSTGQKSPVVYMLILWALATSLKNRSFSYSKNLKLGVLGLIALLGLVFIQNWHLLGGFNLETIQLAWGGLYRRVFYGGVLPLLYYVQYFPDVHPHDFLNTLSAPADQLVYAYAYPDTGIVGTVNTTSLANFYAAFGNSLIVFLLYFIMALFIGIVDRLYFNWMRSYFEFAGYILFCLATVKLVITDWYTVLPSFFVLLLAAFGFVFAIEIFLSLTASYKNKAVFKVRNKFFGYLSLLSFLYLFQGQIRGLILA